MEHDEPESTHPTIEAETAPLTLVVEEGDVLAGMQKTSSHFDDTLNTSTT